MRKFSHYFKKTRDAAVIVLFVFIALVTGHLIYENSKGNVPSFFGHSLLKIITGSMEPELSAGDYLIVKKTAPEDLHEGDIISFYSEDPDIYGMVNTHRIAAVLADGTYITKGDAVPENDKIPVRYEKIIGKCAVSFNIHSFVSYKLILAVVIGAGAVLFVFEIAEIISIVKKKDGDDE